jgi:hypothetical protein
LRTSIISGSSRESRRSVILRRGAVEPARAAADRDHGQPAVHRLGDQPAFRRQGVHRVDHHAVEAGEHLVRVEAGQEALVQRRADRRMDRAGAFGDGFGLRRPSFPATACSWRLVFDADRVAVDEREVSHAGTRASALDGPRAHAAEADDEEGRTRRAAPCPARP